jgi:hypothetical protein
VVYVDVDILFIFGHEFDVGIGFLKFERFRPFLVLVDLDGLVLVFLGLDG